MPLCAGSTLLSSVPPSVSPANAVKRENEREREREREKKKDASISGAVAGGPRKVALLESAFVVNEQKKYITAG